ncbi:uncharacterized protein TNCV_694941 [Trichonephila clavipes]|nr:uncharacterized protein TNCV_694941 [Trichonephila clavipes]
MIIKRKTPAGLDCPIVLLEELFAVDDDDDNECTAPIMTDKDILEFVQTSIAPVSTSSEMRNVVKSTRSYLDAHSNGEISNEMNESPWRLLGTDLPILDYGQVTKTPPELALRSPNFNNTPNVRTFKLGRFNVHQPLHKGLGSNPGEDMDVCKCIVSLRHGGPLNSRRAASLLVRLVEEKERWEALTTSRVLFLKIGVEPSQIEVSPGWR